MVGLIFARGENLTGSERVFMRFILGLIVLSLFVTENVSYGKSRRTPEQILAVYAAHCGTNRVAKDAGDAIGTVFLSAALKMDPDNEMALLTSALLKRE